jgi:ABC-type uncharacterized transport system fused permease/ATPase subunit
VVQVAASFVIVQGALNWVVDNYQRLADWVSSVNRVSSLLLALDNLETAETSAVTMCVEARLPQQTAVIRYDVPLQPRDRDKVFGLVRLKVEELGSGYRNSVPPNFARRSKPASSKMKEARQAVGSTIRR